MPHDPYKALYIHLPFCVKRCGYCDFASETVYLGGGTPSHVGAARLTSLLYALSTGMHLEPEVECTMEANPESLTGPLVRDVWALGVNRLSLGVQSFDDEVLALLGRAHGADEAWTSCAASPARATSRFRPACRRRWRRGPST